MGRSRSVARGLALLWGVAYLTGCHTYTPVQTEPVGSDVRVRVPLTSAISGRNGAVETVGIEGRLIGVGDTLFLATETRRELGAYREITQFDTISVAMDQTSSIEVKEFSTTRSIILGASIAAVAGVAAVIAFNATSGSEGEESPGPGSPDSSLLVSRSLVSVLWGLLGG